MLEDSVIAISPVPAGVAFELHVTPRARRPGVGGCHDGALRIGVAAPPESGRANAACVIAVAAALGVRRHAIHIDPASRHRRKRVRVDGDPQALATRLSELARLGSKS
jgi:hypothetical protein